MGKEQPEILIYSSDGNYDKVNQWIQNRKKKSRLSLFKPPELHSGWLSQIRDVKTGYTPLHYAALNGYYEICKLLIENDSTLITARDTTKNLPIHLASWKGHDLILELLIDSNPSIIDEINSKNDNCLHLAVVAGQGKTVSVLLKKQANPKIRNARHETPLDIAARTGRDHICKLIILHSPELTLQSAAESSKITTKNGDNFIVYPLHVAARQGHIECLRVLLDAGFNINFLTEAGTPLHVAATSGQDAAVKLLLTYGADVNVKDQQGKTVLEKLNELESTDKFDLTHLLQSREGWAECRKTILFYLKNSDNNQNGKENNNQDVIWRTIPQNSLAVNKDNHNENNRISSTSSNGGIYYPPSMIVEHVHYDDHEGNHASTITLSSNGYNGNGNDTLSAENESIGSSTTHSIASGSSVRRQMPKFPMTSPNAKARHANAKRFGNPVLINGIEPTIATDPLEKQETCTYQIPTSSHSLTNQINIENGNNNHSYRNIPQPYDNAPLSVQRKWEHSCNQHGLINNTVGFNGKNNFIRNDKIVRDDGTQTIPALKFNQKARPSVMDVFVQPMNKEEKMKVIKPALPPKPFLNDSKSAEFNKKKQNRLNVAFASSTNDHPIISNKTEHIIFKAPLALPEEISGSTCTSLVSNSPERVLNPIDERLRRSMTTNSEDKTIISMHEDYMASPINDERNEISEKLSHNNNDYENKSKIISPQSDTIESSSSLPQISHLSSSSVTSTRPTSTDIIENNGTENISVSLRDKKSRQQNSQESVKNDMINEAEEWKKIEEILESMHRDSFLLDSNNQLAVTVKNRKSQALTLQLTNPNSSPRYSNICYPSEHDNLKNIYENKQNVDITNIENDIILWLYNDVGLPLARSKEIGEILEKNGFDEVDFMKDTLSKDIMHNLGIDKSIQHQIFKYLDNQTCKIPNINIHEYASDWLSELKLIDYLELFVINDLTTTKKIQSSKLTIIDLKLFGIELIGHLERIIKSLNNSSKNMSNSITTLSTSMRNSSINTTTDITQIDDNNDIIDEKNKLLLNKYVTYSAHYLGSSEISNIEGAEDCRRAMNLMKGRIRQINKVPQVLLQISVNEVNVLDLITNNLVVKHEINKIEIVCQDELDLNCFAYIFQDGDKHFCHVYCVLTADMSREIIVTLGHAFNLAYNMSLEETGK